MQKAGDDPLFIESGPRRKIQRVDAVEFVIAAVFDQPLDRLGHRGVGGPFQEGELGLGIAHGELKWGGRNIRAMRVTDA